MSDKREVKSTDFVINSWWLDWWRDSKNHYFCAIIQFGEEKFYIERELINS